MKKALCIALFLIAAALPAHALDLGDPAPALNVEKWVTGEPVDPTKIDNETFYLVEVWSVTCPPCVDSIPIMNDIQKRYADKGLRIVSFTQDTLEEVEPFLEQHPMEYSSFLDKEGGSVVSYMAADNRNTIPHAFLFDKTGALVWIGNPLDNLESRVKAVLDGTLNAEQAKAIKNARADLQAAFGGQNVSAMIDALKTLEALEPENVQYFQAHYGILTDLGAGDENDVKDLFRTWYNATQDNVESLVTLSMFAMEQGHPKMRDPALGLAAARRAYELGGPNQLQAGLILAETYKAIGRIDLAKKTLDDMTLKADEGEEKEMVEAIRGYYDRIEEVGKNPEAPYNP